eukprot:CAMPEP_0171687954 /NCGR_PEP_ID=MMETSP0991-20121206/3631_1 /TAXON_ID=483369 /ORGANISM="non described non described, Strain CCMP2098" /LENGTH=98 /DNA_ID=CAMNT_0012275851 /DNA_START=667 /DNA_END=960 /DNA_ORIENTATION=+
MSIGTEEVVCEEVELLEATRQVSSENGFAATVKVWPGVNAQTEQMSTSGELAHSKRTPTIGSMKQQSHLMPGCTSAVEAGTTLLRVITETCSNLRANE